MQNHQIVLENIIFGPKDIMPQGPNQILVVEDEPKIALALLEGLTSEGYKVTVSDSGEDAFFQVSSQKFALVLLDVMLPGRSGLEILQALRKNGDSTPVLILTARDSLADRIIGLDSGADDYLIKPFAFAELLARVRALLRRGRVEKLDSVRQLADLELNLVTRQVSRAGQLIELTLREFDLLEYLLRHQGQLVSREMLAKDVWKEASRATSLDNVIDVHMVRLRRKVDQDFSAKIIQTVRGVGFMARLG